MEFIKAKECIQLRHWLTSLLCQIFIVAVFAWAANQTAIAQDHPEIMIWPKGLPAGASVFDADKAKKLIAATRVHPRGHILFVDEPSLTIYQAPQETANGTAVVICPGGGYNVLAWRHEGVDLAEWFNSIGVTAFVLKYRVPRRIEDNIHWEPMQDVQRAIRVVRHNADNYKIDSDRIGVLGFSAGGHLTVMSAVQYETECYRPIDAIDAVSARPDFVCPIYAAYLGENYRDDVAQLSELVSVTEQTPPMFMAVTWGDKMRGAQSALLFSRLRENNVPAELHVYQNGGHGYGIKRTKLPVSKWHHHLENWLEFNGLINGADKDQSDKDQRAIVQ